MHSSDGFVVQRTCLIAHLRQTSEYLVDAEPLGTVEAAKQNAPVLGFAPFSGLNMLVVLSVKENENGKHVSSITAAGGPVTRKPEAATIFLSNSRVTNLMVTHRLSLFESMMKTNVLATITN